jgi:hypothetical protein
MPNLSELINGKCFEAEVLAYGTSEGVTKAWDSRHRRNKQDATYHNARAASKTINWDKAKTTSMHVLSAKQGGPGHAGAIANLHEHGIPARRDPAGSQYVDHVAVQVLQRHADRAEKALWG